MSRSPRISPDIKPIGPSRSDARPRELRPNGPKFPQIVMSLNLLAGSVLQPLWLRPIIHLLGAHFNGSSNVGVSRRRDLGSKPIPAVGPPSLLRALTRVTQR
jgi:hypothetical protein